MNESTSRSNPPFKTLGTHLKYLREQQHESLLEASGAVEIDSDTLERIEAGTERPSEDILLLLIQHYDTQDHEALQLWELAGYDGDASPHKLRLEDLVGRDGSKQILMLLTNDGRIVYSDGLDININQAGLTLNFTQAGGNAKRSVISRIGMSYEQAAEVAAILRDALQRADELRRPKGLPAPRDNDNQDV